MKKILTLLMVVLLGLTTSKAQILSNYCDTIKYTISQSWTPGTLELVGHSPTFPGATVQWDYTILDYNGTVLYNDTLQNVTYPASVNDTLIVCLTNIITHNNGQYVGTCYDCDTLVWDSMWVQLSIGNTTPTITHITGCVTTQGGLPVSGHYVTFTTIPILVGGGPQYTMTGPQGCYYYAITTMGQPDSIMVSTYDCDTLNSPPLFNLHQWTSQIQSDFVICDSSITGIYELDVTKCDDKIYDLMGREIIGDVPTGTTYIRNRKLYINIKNQ